MSLSSKKFHFTTLILLGFIALGIAGYSYYTYKLKEWEALEDLRSDNPITRLEAAEYLVSIQSATAVEYWKELLIAHAPDIEEKSFYSFPLDEWIFKFLTKIEPEGKSALSELIHNPNKAVSLWVIENLDSGNSDSKFVTQEIIKLFINSNHFSDEEKFDELLEALTSVDENYVETTTLLTSLLKKELSEEELDIITVTLVSIYETNAIIPTNHLSEFLKINDDYSQYHTLNYLIEHNNESHARNATKQLISKIIQLAASKDNDVQNIALNVLTKHSKTFIKSFDAQLSALIKKLSQEALHRISNLFPFMGLQSKTQLLQSLFNSTDPNEILIMDNFFTEEKLESISEVKSDFYLDSIRSNPENSPLYFTFFPYLLNQADEEISSKIYSMLTHEKIDKFKVYTFFKWLTYSSDSNLKSFGTQFLKRFENSHPDVEKIILSNINAPLLKLKRLEASYQEYKFFDETIYALIDQAFEADDYIYSETNDLVGFLNTSTLVQDDKFKPTLNQCFIWSLSSFNTYNDPQDNNSFLVRLFEISHLHYENKLIFEYINKADLDAPRFVNFLLTNNFNTPEVAEHLKKRCANPNTNTSIFGSFSFAYWWLKNGQPQKSKKAAIKHPRFYGYPHFKTEHIPHYIIPKNKNDKIQLSRELITFTDELLKYFKEDYRWWGYHKIHSNISKLIQNFGLPIEEVIHEQLSKQDKPNAIATFCLSYLHHHKKLRAYEIIKFKRFLKEPKVNYSFLIEALNSFNSLQTSRHDMQEFVLTHIKDLHSEAQSDVIKLSKKTFNNNSFLFPYLEQLISSQNSELRAIGIWHLKENKNYQDQCIKSLWEHNKVQLQTKEYHLYEDNYPSLSEEPSLTDSLIYFKGKAKNSAQLIWETIEQNQNLALLEDQLLLFKTLIQMGTHQSQIINLLKEKLKSNGPIDYWDLHDIISTFPQPPTELIPLLIHHISTEVDVGYNYYVLSSLDLYGKDAQAAIPRLEEILSKQTDYYPIMWVLNTLSIAQGIQAIPQNRDL